MAEQENRGRRVAKGIGLVVAGAALAAGDVGCFYVCKGNIDGHGLMSAGLSGMYAMGTVMAAGVAVGFAVQGVRTMLGYNPLGQPEEEPASYNNRE